MKELVKPNLVLRNFTELKFYCEIDCSQCLHAECNKNCLHGTGGNGGLNNEEDILF